MEELMNDEWIQDDEGWMSGRVDGLMNGYMNE